MLDIDEHHDAQADVGVSRVPDTNLLMRYPNALGNNAPVERLPKSAVQYTESRSLFRRLMSYSLPVETGRNSGLLL